MDSKDVDFDLCGMDRRIPSRHPTGWAFFDVDAKFVGSNADLVQLRATLAVWGDVGDDENHEEEFIEDRETETESLVSAPMETERRKLTPEEEVDCVMRYLRTVGEVSEVVVNGSYEALSVYLQGHLH